jgi:hypothetical protein
MHDDDHKQIGSATYLNKTNGLYIPFGIGFSDTNCTIIKKLIDFPAQII